MTKNKQMKRVVVTLITFVDSSIDWRSGCLPTCIIWQHLHYKGPSVREVAPIDRYEMVYYKVRKSERSARTGLQKSIINGFNSPLLSSHLMEQLFTRITQRCCVLQSRFSLA